VTGVVEDNIRTFVDNWDGTGLIEGSGDNEWLRLGSGTYMQGEIVNTGITHVELLQNHYKPNGTVTLKYRHGATQEDCLAADWNLYSDPFVSLGYVQVRVEATF
jgi:Ca2+-dependent lipid-binding protein